jgi:tripeptidyl-peptidase-1
MDKLEQILYKVSDPDSEDYGRHLTKSAITDLVAPPKTVQRKVISWVKKAAEEVGAENLIRLTNHKDSLEITATVELIEHLFETDMNAFINKKTKQAVIKHTGLLSIPEDISAHIEMVTGITELPPIDIPFLGSMVQKKENPVDKRQSGDNQCNVPYSIKTLYHIPTDLVVTNPNANQSIYAEISAGTPEGFGIGSVADFESANALPNVSE